MRRLLLPLFLLTLAALPASAGAVPTLDGEFAVSGTPGRITQGPGGDMWVILAGATNDVAKVEPNGDVTEYDLAPISGLADIATGSETRLWVTTANGVASFAAADPVGTKSETANADLSGSQGLVVFGEDLWVAKNATLFHAPLANPANDAGIPLGGVATSARGLALQAGAFWVADFGDKRILRVTPDGTVTSYQVDGGGPQEVAGGPPGQAAYTNPNNEIGRIPVGGSPLKTDTGAIDPFGIALGADGAYWTANFNGDSLSRLTPNGQYSTLPLTPGSKPRHIAAGPGGTLWVSLEGANKVARVSGVDPGPPPPLPDRAAPRLTALSLSATRFRLGSALPRAAQRRRVRTGTTIRFRVSEASKVTLSFAKLVRGKRARGRCVRRTRANRMRRSCTRRVAVRTRVSFDVQAGQRRIRFQGRLTRRRKLRPGRYELSLRAVDAAGNRSATLRKRFTLLPAKQRRR